MSTRILPLTPTDEEERAAILARVATGERIWLNPIDKHRLNLDAADLAPGTLQRVPDLEADANTLELDALDAARRAPMTVDRIEDQLSTLEDRVVRAGQSLDRAERTFELATSGVDSRLSPEAVAELEQANLADLKQAEAIVERDAAQAERDTRIAALQLDRLRPPARLEDGTVELAAYHVAVIRPELAMMAPDAIAARLATLGTERSAGNLAHLTVAREILAGLKASRPAATGDEPFPSDPGATLAEAVTVLAEAFADRAFGALARHQTERTLAAAGGVLGRVRNARQERGETPPWMESWLPL